MSRIKYYFSVFKSILLYVDFYRTRFNLLVLKNGTSFYVRNFMDIWMVIETYIRSDYEVHGLPIGHNWNIIDIGAALGDFSILAAQKSSSNKVFAIEPYKGSYLLLKKNILLNKIKNIVPIDIAVSNKKKIALNINSNNLGNNSEFGTSHTHTLVSAISLKQLLDKYKIKKCHFLKCDCEGAEFEIFDSIDNDTFDKIDNIVMEYHMFSSDFDIDKLISNFQKHNFVVKISPSQVHPNIGFLWAKKIYYPTI